MLLLLQEKDEIIKNMDLKIAQLQSRINLMESDSTYKKHIEIEMEDRHHHNESNHISELVNLKKNIKNLEENLYIEKNHYRKLLLVNKELEVKIDILQNNSRESEKDIDSLKMRINEIQMEKDDMSNNLLEKTQEMDIKNYENENMSQTLHEKIAEQYRNRLSELELVNLDLIQKTDKDKAIITQLSAKNEMLRIENAQHKNGLFENSEILKTERDINRKIKTDCIKYEKMNTDIISQLSCEKKCIENQKNHITTLSKQIENVEEQLSDKQNLLNDKNDLIKNLQNQIEKLSQYKNIKDKLQNVDLYTLSDNDGIVKSGNINANLNLF
ncbi:hypothetical protein A3Q56_06725 [Intoshia linei]|uniref:Uncharacterized protein n=1 Tax=Intoshia linei TaxID=1819745 RepID=A0A177AVY9_9BILA|nr:hypothetical protein A3Q56_06725 [Intoshia linei]